MTDYSASGALLPRSFRRPQVEFRFYFALIFLIAVPLACLAWIGAAVLRGRLSAQNPVSRAWHQAGEITPYIFQG